MIALAVTLAILVLFALLRFAVSVEYCADGLFVKMRVGPLSMRIVPSKDKPISEETKAKRKARKEEKDRKKAEKKARKKTDEKKPGALKTVLDMLPAIKKMLSRLRRRLLIKKLIIYYSIASDDPYKTALTFGTSNAVVGTIIPLLESSFRIKKSDVKVFANFYDTQQSIYINAAISLAVWEAVYIVFAVIPAGIRILLNKEGATDRKDGKKNGSKSRQDPNKRPDGNDNEKS